MKNPLSLEAFTDWCAAQPPEKEYNYWDSRDCALAQYGKFLGLENPTGGGWDLQFNVNGERRKINIFPPNKLSAVAAQPYTFGALTDRLRSPYL